MDVFQHCNQFLRSCRADQVNGIQYLSILEDYL